MLQMECAGTVTRPHAWDQSAPLAALPPPRGGARTVQPRALMRRRPDLLPTHEGPRQHGQAADSHRQGAARVTVGKASCQDEQFQSRQFARGDAVHSSALLRASALRAPSTYPAPSAVVPGVGGCCPPGDDGKHLEAFLAQLREGMLLTPGGSRPGVL